MPQLGGFVPLDDMALLMLKSAMSVTFINSFEFYPYLASSSYYTGAGLSHKELEGNWKE